MTAKTNPPAAAADEWMHCVLCESLFGRRRETKRICKKCHIPYCDGEHGSNFRGPELCVGCLMRAEKKLVDITDHSKFQ